MWTKKMQARNQRSKLIGWYRHTNIRNLAEGGWREGWVVHQRPGDKAQVCSVTWLDPSASLVTCSWSKIRAQGKLRALWIPVIRAHMSAELASAQKNATALVRSIWAGPHFD